MALELVSGVDFVVQIDARGGPGRSQGVPGAPAPPRPRKRLIFSQIQNHPLLNPPLATADSSAQIKEPAVSSQEKPRCRGDQPNFWEDLEANVKLATNNTHLAQPCKVMLEQLKHRRLPEGGLAEGGLGFG